MKHNDKKKNVYFKETEPQPSHQTHAKILQHFSNCT